MKKIQIYLSVALMFMATATFAQKSARTSAYMYNEKGQLDKAKAEIDKAIEHPKTMNDPKTWLYRGLIYYNIAVSPLPAYHNLDSTAAQKALESLLKAKELDAKGKFTDDIKLNLHNLTGLFYQEGIDGFNEKNYEKAIKAFENAVKVGEAEGTYDTVAAFNIGMSAVLAHKPDLAGKYLKECVEKDFKDPRVYMFYSRTLKMQGDTAAAFQVLQQGRKRFPENLKLLLEEAQMYLEEGQSDKLIESLKEAIAKDPDNPGNANFNFLIGKSYDDKGDVTKAEEYYKKALELKPDFFEAYYNIGAIYVNKASELQKKANELPLEETEKYNKLNNEANENLKKALPWLEKSLQLRPDDEPTLHALKEAYIRLKMNDKLKELNK